MPKILFLSNYGDGADIALRIKNSGNQVRLWIKDPKFFDVYDGILDKVPDWQSSVSWADLIVIDNNKLPGIWRQVHKVKPTFGGSEFGMKLENDREFGHEVMEKIGITPIESLKFNKSSEVVAHLKEHSVKHVIKPTGNKHVESHHTIISDSEDGEDAVSLLERLDRHPKAVVDNYMVEERKEGVEMALSGWFNGTSWVGPVNLNFEHKKIANGEVGYTVGEAGTLVKYLEKPPELYHQTLEKITPILQENDYRGQLDLNMIINEEGVYPLEWTPRLGYPSVFIEDELHVTPWEELLDSIARGFPLDFKVSYDWAVGVVIFSLGMPTDEEYMRVAHEMPIMGVSESNIAHVHLMRAKLLKNKLVTAAGDAYTLVVTGRGETIEEAKEKAYSHLLEPERVYVPNAIYRTDISDKIASRMPEIEKYLKGKVPV